MSLRYWLCTILSLSCFLNQASAEGRGFFGLFKKKKDPRSEHISSEYLNPTPVDPNSVSRALPLDGSDQNSFYTSEFVPSFSGTVKGSVWSAKDEAEFSEWVKAIGESGCNTPQSCLNSSANKLRENNEDFSIYPEIDCGRLPYLLRGYFAIKKKLPFSMTTDVRPLGPLGDMPDPIRYTPAGNAVQQRRWVMGGDPEAERQLYENLNPLTTKTMRIPANLDDSDFYTINVNNKNITPGTIYYDASGHAGMVYKVDDRGIIHTLNGQPGSTISRKTFKAGNFQTGSTLSNGGGFKKFRPIVEDNGHLRLASNTEIPDYSLEQYRYDGHAYFDYIEKSTSAGSDPLYVFYLNIKELCENFGARVNAVENARLAGIPNKPLERLPTNIYGASGEWEAHSTPSADLRIKANVVKTSQQVKRDLEANPNLKKEMQKLFIKFEHWETCRFSYTNSAGNKVNLGLMDVFNRAYDISFDPYQCPELRMGAPAGSAELGTCNSGPEKLRWYKAQSTLRNRLDKDVNLNTGFDVAELESRKQSMGPSKGQPADLLDTLF